MVNRVIIDCKEGDFLSWELQPTPLWDNILTTPPVPGFDTIRADFPRATNSVYLDNASCHADLLLVASVLHEASTLSCTCSMADTWEPE